MKKLLYILVLLIMREIPALGQTAPIPDPKLLQCLKDNASSTVNASNQLIISQAATVTSLGCVGYDISNLDGLQYFTGLTFLDLDDNQITSATQISSLTALQTARLENNYLTSLPNLSGLTSLKTLVAYDNFLETLPDLSANTQLQTLDVDNNKLKDLPSLTANTNLTTLRVRNNYLSFSDLVPFLSFSGTLSNNPQKKVPVQNPQVSVFVNGDLTLTSGLDHSLSGVTYKWYKNATLIGTVSNDTIVHAPVALTDAGDYYAVLTHPSFAFSITTDTLEVTVLNCPSFQVSPKRGRINCLETGSLELDPPTISPSLPASAPAFTFKYYLTSPVTNDTIVSSNGNFEGLNQPQYLLIIKTGTVCESDTLIDLPFEDCREVFITPDGDGDKDSHFFPAEGTAVIYDKHGNTVATLELPGEWDGSSKAGVLVSPGYYSADINKGEKHVNISVLY